MKEQYIRTAMLFGMDAVNKLKNKRVIVFGIGGVGGHVVEVLARSGVGAIDLVDHDTVAMSNINRQLIATYETLGRKKIDVMKERILSIQPDCKVTTWDTFYLPEESEKFPFASYDYIVDAIDTVTAKIDLVLQAEQAKVPIISSMGTGNKLDPTKLTVTDIYKTSVCPLAKVMRRELKKRGIQKLKVVYSTEEALTPIEGLVAEDAAPEAEQSSRRATPGSNAFVPATAGLLIGSEVVKDLM
ncbi:MAG: tRNA threonylcarbamoyladenosine dehydratase [Lachnospiraceae bacterium]|nr:tRNA threonylcarbamoyladenosine dehydratase [Lachnospiraceae bacterium]MBR2403521.1 tRNA threonylcarbamoyladenosine dehydratase [Lachnospiraceae bacterium]MBR4060303.1 tRNA threonylcarbamoyladenosine dehydratase [Lachnospiraceae bacterium]